MWVLGGAVGVLVVWCVVLVRVDERRHRLPDTLTLPAAGGAALGALLTEPVVLCGGLAWAVVYLGGRGIGGGDVKLALPLGIVAAAAGGVGGVIVAVAVAGLVTALRAWARGGPVPHGVSMLVGASSAVLLGL